jgi:Spore coat protein CotO
LHTYKSGELLGGAFVRKEKNAGREPMLYINQPTLEEVKGNMQVTYRSTKKKSPPQSQPLTESKHNINLSAAESLEKQENQENKFLDEKSIVLHEDQNENSATKSIPQLPERKTAATAFRRLKPFRDLSINEKLEYISASISGKVPFPCEFSNGEMTVKGVILVEEEDEIIVKSFQGEEVKMKKNELQSIKMIGLQ